MITVNQVLDHAIDILNTRGWCQGTDQDDRGRCCLYGAIGLAERRTRPDARVFSEVRTRLRQVIGGYPVKWNDDPDRTVEEVLAALEKAKT